MEVRGCPIRMVAVGSITSDFFNIATCADESILEARMEWFKQSIECFEKKCEWHENGCPSHPGKQ